LLCGLLAGALSAAEAPAVRFTDGPASVTLGAEAQLELPVGWRFVAREDLAAYFAGSPRQAGAWDRGLVLAGDPVFELRLQFEPLGRVPLEPLPDVEALLAQAQGLAQETARRNRVAAGMGRELAFWRWEPFFESERKALRFGGVWREGADETVSLQLRWLGRRGVLKLDWRGAEDDANAFIAVSEQLDEALRFQPGHGWDDAQAGESAAKLDLSALVLDGLFGRGAAAVGGAPIQAERPLWAWILGSLAAALAAAWAALQLWRRLDAWLTRRQKAKKDAQRLDYIEKKYGGGADGVEEIEEEGQEGYGGPSQP
jgi:uncharacterized membrane-anchored protein